MRATVSNSPVGDGLSPLPLPASGGHRCKEGRQDQRQGQLHLSQDFLLLSWYPLSWSYFCPKSQNTRPITSLAAWPMTGQALPPIGGSILCCDWQPEFRAWDFRVEGLTSPQVEDQRSGVLPVLAKGQLLLLLSGFLRSFCARGRQGWVSEKAETAPLFPLSALAWGWGSPQAPG